MPEASDISNLNPNNRQKTTFARGGEYGTVATSTSALNETIQHIMQNAPSSVN